MGSNTEYIRVVEAFYSLQGEGLHIGVPSVFLRLSGCNFKCAGFGMLEGDRSVEFKQINPEKYTHLKDLPVVSTGCDSFATWDPRCAHLTNKMAVGDIAKHLLSLTPEQAWQTRLGQPIHLVVTGGEPLLAWQKALPNLFNLLVADGLKYLSFETNATQKLQPEMIDFFESDHGLDQVLFTCSPKLSNSGEPWIKAICPEVVAQYAAVPKSVMVLKFVVQSEKCFEEVVRAVKSYKQEGVTCRVYCMPVGSHHTHDTPDFHRKMADLAMHYGFSYSSRLHVDLWDNAWAT